MRKKTAILVLSASLSIMASMTAFAGSWLSDTNGWWWQEGDGSYPISCWKEINGKYYYFGVDGYMLSNTTTPDGYQVGADGVYVQKSEAFSGKYSDGTHAINPVIFEDMNTPSGELLIKYNSPHDYQPFPCKLESVPISSSDKSELELDLPNAPFPKYVGYTKFEKGKYFPEYDVDGDGVTSRRDIEHFFELGTPTNSQLNFDIEDKYLLDRDKPPCSIKGKILEGFTNESYPVEEIGSFVKKIGAKNVDVVNRNTTSEKSETIFMNGTFYSRRTGEMETNNVTSISFELDGLKFSARGEWGKIYPQKTEWLVTK